MRRIRALSLVMGAAAVLLAAATAASPQESEVDRLSWLAGCWIMESPNGMVIEEQWMKPRGGAMLGASRTVRAGRVIEYETIRIFAREPDGRAVYAAQPSGQAGASFTATLVSDTLVVFENPQHDFPQEIRYHRHAPDSVRASIEGPRGGQTRTVAFPYARASCR